MKVKIRVIPLGKKMREKVKQYGEIWYSLGFDGERTHIETLMAVHAGGHPYSVWVYSKDCRLEPLYKFHSERKE